jgi:hypothetical protein
MNLVEQCKELHYKFREFLDVKNYEKVRELIESLFDADVNLMKTALIITKGFKEHETIKDSRAKLLEKLEKKLGDVIA